MKRITAKSGIKGYECRLRENYADFGEFKAYSENYGLAEKLGFKTAIQAWHANPTIQGSANPDDFRIAPSTPVDEVKDKQEQIQVVGSLVGFKIPPEAKLIVNECHIITDIEEWFCPDCETKGDADTADWVTLKDSPVEENKIVKYCCPNCFEQNIYATFLKD